jgi:hypothetical protein
MSNTAIQALILGMFVYACLGSVFNVSGPPVAGMHFLPFDNMYPPPTPLQESEASKRPTAHRGGESTLRVHHGLALRTIPTLRHRGSARVH